MKIRGKNIARSLMAEFIPDFAEGAIGAAVKDKPIKEATDWFLNNDLWDSIPEKYQKMALAYTPDDMRWLTPEWVTSAIAKTNKLLASKIMGSPSLQDRVAEQIETIKQRLQVEA